MEQTLAHWKGCGWFWAWAAVGVGYGFWFSVIGALTFIPATLAVVFMTRRRPIQGAWGVATGVGVPLLYVGYRSIGDGSYNPVHWLIPGLVLFLGGMAAHVMTRPG
jgi:hypothetical protein